MNEQKAPLDLETCKELSKLLNRKHAALLDGRFFTVISKTEEQHTHVCVLLSNEDESFFYPVEAKMDHSSEDLEKAEAAHFLIDYLDLYFDDFFNDDEELYLPIDWANHEYEGNRFAVKGQIRNKKIEDEADFLLSNHNTSNTILS